MELSNIHRQVAHTEAAVGRHKADSAAAAARALNSSIQVAIPCSTRLLRIRCLPGSQPNRCSVLANVSAQDHFTDKRNRTSQASRSCRPAKFAHAMMRNHARFPHGWRCTERG